MYLVMSRVGWKSLILQFLSKSAAQKITEHIIIGDWNAHHPAWLDQNTDDVGDCILDFITSNGLHIINTLPYQVLISHYVHHLFFHLLVIGERIILIWMCTQITFNIKTTWSSPRIETWEQFRLRLILLYWILDKAVESWTKCVVEAGGVTIESSKIKEQRISKQLQRKLLFKKHQHMDDKHYDIVKKDIIFK
ncbi:hypothetical protein RFI_00392, partial [Reticulomyxa filosa]